MPQPDDPCHTQRTLATGVVRGRSGDQRQRDVPNRSAACQMQQQRASRRRQRTARQRAGNQLVRRPLDNDCLAIRVGFEQRVVIDDMPQLRRCAAHKAVVLAHLLLIGDKGDSALADRRRAPGKRMPVQLRSCRRQDEPIRRQREGGIALDHVGRRRRGGIYPGNPRIAGHSPLDHAILRRIGANDAQPPMPIGLIADRCELRVQRRQLRAVRQQNDVEAHRDSRRRRDRYIPDAAKPVPGGDRKSDLPGEIGQRLAEPGSRVLEL